MPKISWKLGIAIFFLIGLITNITIYQSNVVPNKILKSLGKNLIFDKQANQYPFSSSSKIPERQLLPTNVKPTNYNLTLNPNFETFKFDGNVVIRYEFFLICCLGKY